MLSTSGLTLHAGKKRLIADVSLQLHPGEVLAVAGPNGAGKSSLLRALSGELTPVSGDIRLNGRLLADWQPQRIARLRAVLPQHSPLSFRFIVRDVVLMGRSPHRHSHDSGQNLHIVEQAMALTDTTHLAERIYTTLSGGERQRVHLARVLAQIWQASADGTRYLLLDEPTSALDLAHQHAVLAIARHFADREHVGVLAVLHDLNLAALYADRMALLRDGHLMAVGPPEQILASELIRQVFDHPAEIIPHPLYPERPLMIAHRLLDRQ
ncbi:MAG: heme ABC transporter ATP-binding protein [Methylomonas sp.]|nr:heme ABC transporter ATP-binding protein [Methylomonas sp.]PPD21696.1 MAG: heme ABC transporter ATP-binding protein [Methylomonas sp.]PPD25761.1 MAG: heme ABC transporter ATP-binding protein [Methylomonas sp.]PPD37008.1 MAG: heme ABC transporter ATP-binding protein [Methylomonas sp.]PPD40672.1 MAG: heme ABC transporter ATP-binding protein [Methylomonas sp.]